MLGGNALMAEFPEYIAEELARVELSGPLTESFFCGGLLVLGRADILLDNDFGSFEEILGGEVGVLGIRWLVGLFFREFGSGQENGSTAGGFAGLGVAGLITYHPALAQVDTQLLSGL